MENGSRSLQLVKTMSNYFETNRLILNPIDESALKGEYVNWFNDAEVCKYNSHFRIPYSEEKCTDYIKNTLLSDNAIVMTIKLKDKGVYIGNVSLQNINYIDRNAEIAWIIGEANFWGQGYATEAAGPLIGHAKNALNLHRLYLGTLDNNVAMQKVAVKLGFNQEGIRKEALFKNGAYHDIYEYGLILG